MRSIVRLGVSALACVMLAWTTLVHAQSSTEICSIWIWNPDGPNNSAKCYALNEDGTTDVNHLVAHAINTTEGDSTRLELDMVNPDWRFCPFDLTRIKCVASGNLVDWTEFTESTVVYYDGPTIPVLVMSCSCY